MVKLINHVFGQMKLIFGRKYSSRFKSSEEVSATKRMWMNGFALAGVTPKAAEHAMNQILVKKMEWPPELSEFLQLCDEALAEGLPAPEDALAQIISRRGKYRFEERFTWLHRVVEETNIRIGHYLTKESEASFKSRFKQEYRRVIHQFKQGELPEPKPALPAPDLPARSAGAQVDPQCDMQKRLAALRALSGGQHE